MTAHDICANSAHDPVCEQLMDAQTSMPTASVVVTSPKLTLMATLIGEVHSNFGIRNSVCRLLRILLRRI